MSQDLVLMTEKTLNAVKGWPNPHAVDFTAVFAQSVLDAVDVVRPGSCVHLNDTGELELGVGSLDVMPMFTFFSSDDPVVVNFGGDPATKKGGWVAVTPTGQMLCLPAKIAAELVSTEFDPDEEDDLTPNALLTSPTSGGNAGKLVVGTKYTDTICGFVSRGVVDNGYGYDAIAFWPWVILPTA